MQSLSILYKSQNPVLSNDEESFLSERSGVLPDRARRENLIFELIVSEYVPIGGKVKTAAAQ